MAVSATQTQDKREAVQGQHYVLPLFLTVATAVCGLGGWICARQSWPAASLLLYALAYLAGSYGPLVTALEVLRNRRLDINFLMLLAAWGSAALGSPGEGAALLFLFTLSGALEEYTLDRTARSIDSLMQLRPETVRVVTEDGKESVLPVLAVQPGALVRVVPGERVGVDGVVVEGESTADESTLTGESLPVDKRPGSEVYAGTLNQHGSLLVRTTRASAESLLSRIVELVHSAQAEKVSSQSRFERWQSGYVVAVMLLSLASFAAAYLGLLGNSKGALGPSVYSAMVFLVAASPCAVLLSIPAAVLSGLTRAARQGVLFKGGSYLEKLAAVRAFAFDKTGTLTHGEPIVLEVRELSGNPQGASELLEAAAAVERLSEHPLAEAVVRAAASKELPLPKASEFHSHAGQGVHASVAGADGEVWVGIGTRLLFSSHSVDLADEVLMLAEEQRARGMTSLIVSACGRQGVIGIADRLRADAAEALAILRRQGVQHLAVLTGDHQQVGESVAASVGADIVRAGLLPSQKVEVLRELQAKFGSLAFVGDGVNDGPALAAADVGFAMGGRGSDVALETADVVLMRDDLRAIPFAYWLARRTQAAITRGLWIAFGVILFLLYAATFLQIPLWLAVLLHEGSTVVTILSGMLLLIEPYRTPA